MYPMSPRRLGRPQLNTIIENEIQSLEAYASPKQQVEYDLVSPAASFTSTISSYYQKSRHSENFDDLYDATDSESEDVLTPVAPLFSKSTMSNPSLLSPRSWNATSPGKPVGIKRRSSPPPLHRIPSLDGSLVSEQVQSCSAPITPAEAHFPVFEDQVLLSPEAEAMLARLSRPMEMDIEIGTEMVESPPKRLTLQTSVPRAVDPLQSAYSMTDIELPPMSALFTDKHELTGNTNTHKPALPLAEQELVVSQQETQIPLRPRSWSLEKAIYTQLYTESPKEMDHSKSRNHGRHSVQPIDDSRKPETSVDKLFQQEPKQAFDRMSGWLSQQNNLRMSLLEDEDGPLTAKKIDSGFASQVALDESRSPSSLSRRSRVPEPIDTAASNSAIYYQAFQHMSNSSSPTDSFIHRNERLEAVQARRMTATMDHIDSILGQFRSNSEHSSAVPPSTPEQQAFVTAETERKALEEVESCSWVVEAFKYISGGRLLNSPASNLLDYPVRHQRSVRILDLGGQPTAEWAWFCAREYPHAKLYTVTADENRAHDLHGPRNHRVVDVDNLWTLPFQSNFFDIISARSLFALLQSSQHPNSSASLDQLDKCLKECMRILKPGGYLEFFVMDAEIMHAGPVAHPISVEFAVNLFNHGYDASPTKSWLSKLRKAGLTGIKRSWMYLPVGSTQEQETRRGSTSSDLSGTTNDTASITGLVGSWVWESWMLKTGNKLEADRIKMAEKVASVVLEGRQTGAGWRCLSGWARKPSYQF